MHKYVKMVNEHCKRENKELEREFAKRINVPGKEVYSWNPYMTVFGHNGKAYAIAGRNIKRSGLVVGGVYDISETTPEHEHALFFGGSHHHSADALEQGRLLGPEECRKIWSEAGFGPEHVARLLYDGGYGLEPEQLKQALENAGVGLSRSEMEAVLKKAGIYTGNMDEALKRMYGG